MFCYDCVIFFVGGPLTDMAFRSMPDMTNMAAAIPRSLKEDFIGHSEHISNIIWKKCLDPANFIDPVGLSHAVIGLYLTR